jgi:DNA-directed RNA polymerase subunit F
LFLTGPVVHKLNPEIARNILLRVNLISRSHKIQTLVFELIANSYKSELFTKISKDEQNELLETLYELSGINSELGTKAVELYTRITSEITNL